jgi:hypothetical protein
MGLASRRTLVGADQPANVVKPASTTVLHARSAGAVFGHYALPEFAKQKLPANTPAPGSGHEHGEAVPLPTAQAHRDFIAVVSESLANECQEPRQMVRMVDITFESSPVGVSTWTVPEASGNFCSRGGRFGSHSSQEKFTPIYYGRVLFVTFFNAGVRALDIRDPLQCQRDRPLCPGDDEKHGPPLRWRRRQRALQGCDSIEQRRGR